MNEERIDKFGRAFADRGLVNFPVLSYGESLNGIPLEYYPASSGETDILIFAGLHGSEPETCILLSRALRSLKDLPARCSVIISANPDGLLRGTRGNARGVDLNRNFPASNWSPEPVTDWWIRNHQDRAASLSTGSAAASEPETVALLKLIEKLKPGQIISLHAPLACIDDVDGSELAQWISRRSGLGLVDHIGYPTPGSFGSWAEENKISLITYELPLDSWWNMQEVHLPILQELLCFGMDVLLQD